MDGQTYETIVATTAMAMGIKPAGNKVVLTLEDMIRVGTRLVELAETDYTQDWDSVIREFRYDFREARELGFEYMDYVFKTNPWNAPVLATPVVKNWKAFIQG